METVAPIIGRGLVLDIAALHGVAAAGGRLRESPSPTCSDALEKAGKSVRRGDIVIVRTGKIQHWNDPPAFQAAEPGVGSDAAVWLYDAGMAVLATDTTGTEPLPFADPAQTTHRAMLVERGVHLLENLDLEAVGADGVPKACSSPCR